MARILIVDDEDVIRELLARQLATDGHVCETASNGRAAVEKVRETEYDLILTDLKMPQGGGLDFLRTVRERVENTTPSIVITAHGDINFAIDAMDAGASYYIRKPWEFTSLREAVARGLKRRAAFLTRRSREADLERRVREAVAELREQNDETVLGFAVLLEGRKADTREHCIRVRNLCSRIGLELGLDAERLRDLELGAMLHDIGKYKIPDAIVDKPAKLTPEEWELMRRHPEYGAEAVEKIKFLRGGRDVILAHHERWDGSGYPRGLRGEDIPLAARIFMVVDAYDAITSKRSYKEAQDARWALEEIRRCAGTHFDPAVVAAFERVYQEFAAETRQRTVAPTSAGSARLAAS